MVGQSEPVPPPPLEEEPLEACWCQCSSTQTP